jgi:hypothetical protein
MGKGGRPSRSEGDQHGAFQDPCHIGTSFFQPKQTETGASLSPGSASGKIVRPDSLFSVAP